MNDSTSDCPMYGKPRPLHPSQRPDSGGETESTELDFQSQPLMTYQPEPSWEVEVKVSDPSGRVRLCDDHGPADPRIDLGQIQRTLRELHDSASRVYTNN